jgi:hypothetical protein
MKFNKKNLCNLLYIGLICGLVLLIIRFLYKNTFETFKTSDTERIYCRTQPTMVNGVETYQYCDPGDGSQVICPNCKSTDCCDTPENCENDMKINGKLTNTACDPLLKCPCPTIQKPSSMPIVKPGTPKPPSIPGGKIGTPKPTINSGILISDNEKLWDAISYSNGSPAISGGKLEKTWGNLYYCDPGVKCAGGLTPNSFNTTGKMCGVNSSYCTWEEANPSKEQCSKSCAELPKQNNACPKIKDWQLTGTYSGNPTLLTEDLSITDKKLMPASLDPKTKSAGASPLEPKWNGNTCSKGNCFLAETENNSYTYNYYPPNRGARSGDKNYALCVAPTTNNTGGGPA